MKFSAKVRYALAATIRMAQLYDVRDSVTLISLSEELDISKIYLEQIFSLLKRGDVVSSIKGARGGYRLNRPPQNINALDVVASVDPSLFEENDKSVPDNAFGIDAALQVLAYSKAKSALTSALSSISLEALANEANHQNQGKNFMYYL
ncbi:MAG: Rrf2 family transcriptional regulator [Burkholderiales bacterium]|jgi:Rrf2 family protein|nr:Rrf2 family transcriptional regulator [Burkholderiales bacterium]